MAVIPLQYQSIEYKIHLVGNIVRLVIRTKILIFHQVQLNTITHNGPNKSLTYLSLLASRFSCKLNPRGAQASLTCGWCTCFERGR